MNGLEAIHGSICYYCFWTLFYGLGPMIWFYPLNKLDITGYEIFAAIWLIPVITAIPVVREVISSSYGKILLEMGMASGIASFRMGTTLSRLVLLTIGNGAAMLFICGKLFSGLQSSRLEECWLFLGSNFLYLGSRVWMTSMTPAWADHRTNWIILCIFGISIASNFIWKDVKFSSSRQKRSKKAATNVESRNASNTRENNEKTPPPEQASVIPSLRREMVYGLFLGSLLYMTHWIFGDLHVLSRWATIGVTSPPSFITPYYTAPLVLMALSAGSILASTLPNLSTSIACWILGTAAFFGTYFLDGSSGFTYGLMLAVYCTILWVTAFRKITVCRPWVTVTVAMLVYLAEIFFHVWTVAFNFVPLGVYTRERSDLLIGFMCMTLFAGCGKYGGAPKAQDRPKMFLLLLTASLLVTGGGLLRRLSSQPTGKTLDPKTRDFTALVWTFHFGYDNAGWPSLDRAAAILNETNADVIALLESDASKPYMGNNDLAVWLSEKLGMFVDFGPATKDHTWGNLLLSKYPIVNSTHHLLPSPDGEVAPAIFATLNISGELIDIISTHMGNDRDVLDRQLQCKYLSNLAAEAAHPVVFLGYVTSRPFTREYLMLTDEGLLKDIDPTDTRRFCEYIFYRGLIRQGFARIAHGGLSDTELQLAKFSILQGKEPFQDNELIERDPGNVEPWKKFSGAYGDFRDGHYGLWDHRYHMSTPKYFVSNVSG